jgi:hypothetical protein
MALRLVRELPYYRRIRRRIAPASMPKTTRSAYNETVRAFNAQIQNFRDLLLAGPFGFRAGAGPRTGQG